MKDFSQRQVFAVEQRIPGEIPSLPPEFVKKFPEIAQYNQEQQRFWRKLRAALQVSSEQIEEESQATQQAVNPPDESIGFVTGDQVDAAIAAALAGGSFSSAVNAAVAAALASYTPESYPAQGTPSSAQAVPTTGVATKLVIAVTPVNTAGAMSVAASRYTAPATGVYHVGFTSQWDNISANAANLQVCVDVYKNGSAMGLGTCSSTPNPVGQRWFPGFSTLVQLNAGDYIEVWAELDDGASNHVNVTTFDWSVHRVR